MASFLLAEEAVDAFTMHIWVVLSSAAGCTQYGTCKPSVFGDDTSHKTLMASSRIATDFPKLNISALSALPFRREASLPALATAGGADQIVDADPFMCKSKAFLADIVQTSNPPSGNSEHPRVRPSRERPNPSFKTYGAGTTILLSTVAGRAGVACCEMAEAVYEVSKNAVPGRSARPRTL
jgi:hypothetical protein